MVTQLRHSRALPWTMTAFLLVMLFWPWPPLRFLVPFLLFLVAYLLAEVAGLFCRLLPRADHQFAALIGLTGVIVLANVGLLARHTQLAHQSGYPLMQLNDTAVRWSSYERVFAWLRAHSRPDDVVTSGVDSMVALYTDRRAFRPFVYSPGCLFYGQEGPTLGTVEEMAAILKRYQPRYLVHTPMPGFPEEKPFEELLGQLRRRHPGWLVSVYQDDDPRFVVFELNSQKEPGW